MVVNLATESASGADIGLDIVRNIENVTGGSGDNQITGVSKDNVLNGGAGSDVIDGGDGLDTAVFHKNRSDYTIMLLPSGAILVVDGSEADTLTNIEIFRFSDGFIAFDDLIFDDHNEPVTIIGSSGDDELHGTSGDDVLDGLGGNDQLFGWAGSDTYMFSRGHGADTIDDWDDAGSVDIIRYGAGIAPSDVQVYRGAVFGDVVLDIGNGDTISIKGGFHAFSTVIEQVHFADSTVWTINDLRQIYLTQSSTSGNDTITGFDDTNDTINGAGGNDTIYAGGGNDTVNGGTGDDILFGDAGNDIIIGGIGNDFMIGGSGADTFIINDGDGQDWINDFEVGIDKIDVRGVAALTNFATLKATAREWVSGSTWIYADDNNYVRLEGVSIAQLQESDFLFA